MVNAQRAAPRLPLLVRGVLALLRKQHGDPSYLRVFERMVETE